MSRPSTVLFSLGFVIFLPQIGLAGERTVVLFGDSTSAERGGLRIYAHHLQETDFGAVDLKIVNAAVPGDHTNRGLARFNRDVLSKEPDVVVIQFGINDSAIDVWRDPPATSSRVSLDDYRRNIRTFIEGLKSKGVLVVLMTPNPLRWTPKLQKSYGKPPYDPADVLGFDKPLRPYVEAVRSIAKEKSTPLVDVHALFNVQATDEDGVNGLLLDGMHPNERGHALIAKTLIRVLGRSLQGKQSGSE